MAAVMKPVSPRPMLKTMNSAAVAARARLRGGGMSRPEGVRIVHPNGPNGAWTRCELAPARIARVNAEDIQMWTVATPLRPADSIAWDDILPRTGITGTTEGEAL